MDWLILILGIPAILIPLVLLFGFAGCCPAAICTDDQDCPGGTQCNVDGQCVLASEPDPRPPPLSAPENLAAIALDDQSVFLTWTADPAATDFQIERAEEGDEPQPITPRGPISPTGTTGMTRRAWGDTCSIMLALADGKGPDASVPRSLPATPVNYHRVSIRSTCADQWSTVATEFSLNARLPGGAFGPTAPIGSPSPRFRYYRPR